MRIVITAVALFTLAVGTSAQQAATHFDGKTWWEHVKFLADDSLEGRDTGSEIFADAGGERKIGGDFVCGWRIYQHAIDAQVRGADGTTGFRGIWIARA